MRKQLIGSALLCLLLAPASSRAATKYWDINGATTGAGGATPTGNWDTTTANWSTSSAGTAAATTWAAGDDAVFSAGTDATGTFTVTTTAAQTANSITVEEGTVQHSGTSANTLTTSGLTINSGGVFSVLTALTFTPPAGSTCTLNGGTIQNRNTGTGSSFLTSSSANSNMKINLGTGGGHVSATGGSGIATIYTGLISGTGPLTVDGNGIFRLTTTTATYSGATVINGRLQISTTANVLPSATDVTVNSGGTLDVENTLTIGSLAGAGTLLFVNSGTTLTSGNSLNTTFSGPVSGPGVFTKVGTGTLTIQGNDWANTGAININAGTIKYGNSAAGFSSSSTVTIASGAQLDMNNINDTFGMLNGAGNIINGANINLAGTATSGTTFSGSYSGTGTLTKSGSGTETFSAANSFSSVALNAGRINVQDSGALGSGTITVTPTANVLLVNNGSSLTVTLNNPMTLNASAFTVDLSANSGDTLNLNGKISGAADWKKDNTASTGKVVLGNSANDFTGSVTVFAGTLGINSIANVGGGASSLGAPTTVASGTVKLGSTTSTATLQYTGSGHTSDRVIDLAGTTGGATIDASGTGPLVLSSALTASGAGIKTLTLTGTSTAANTIAGPIVDNSSANTTSLTKSGAGTWVLSAANTFSGKVAINAGVLSVNAVNRLGALPASAVADQVSLNSGTLQYTAGASASGANRGFTLNSGGGTFDVSSGQTLTIQGVVAGAGGLTKTGAGTLALEASGANTFSGKVLISQGTLSIAGASRLGTLPGSVVPDQVTIDGATLKVTAATQSSGANRGYTLGANNATWEVGSGVAFDVDAVVAGTGSLTKEGSGTLTLKGANTFTGNTIVNGGTLAINGSTDPASSVSVGPGGTLGGSGTVNGSVSISGTLAPGNSVGTLTLASAPALSGTTLMELTNKVGVITASDKLVVSSGTMTCGGALSVVLLPGSDPLAGGETFDLFDASGFGGSFAATNLPPLGAGLNWWTDMLMVDGTITVNRAPSALDKGYTRQKGVSLKIAKADLLAGAADPDSGDSVSFDSLMSMGTEGATITQDATYVYYAPANDNSDTLTYRVKDARGGFSAAKNIAITVVNGTGQAQTISVSGGIATVTFAGIPGFAYDVQRSTNLVDWVTILTTNAPGQGLFQVSDDFADLGVPPDPAPSSAFYRLHQP